ncbi:hypothetical protein Dda_7196 [Drechslerella dactyloides]|uniref:F-box domain-containing protein n=1 Tax=Drechslerella dactyloides TaxID=74499 RepID=A0AAD6ITU0_DREDA|nr:hypothetical protein Dda_7196 [Drechslerella dactyloides]
MATFTTLPLELKIEILNHLDSLNDLSSIFNSCSDFYSIQQSKYANSIMSSVFQNDLSVSMSAELVALANLRELKAGKSSSELLAIEFPRGGQQLAPTENSKLADLVEIRRITGWFALKFFEYQFKKRPQTHPSQSHSSHPSVQEFRRVQDAFCLLWLWIEAAYEPTRRGLRMRIDSLIEGALHSAQGYEKISPQATVVLGVYSFLISRLEHLGPLYTQSLDSEEVSSTAKRYRCFTQYLQMGIPTLLLLRNGLDGVAELLRSPIGDQLSMVADVFESAGPTAPAHRYCLEGSATLYALLDLYSGWPSSDIKLSARPLWKTPVKTYQICRLPWNQQEHLDYEASFWDDDRLVKEHGSYVFAPQQNTGYWLGGTSNTKEGNTTPTLSNQLMSFDTETQKWETEAAEGNPTAKGNLVFISAGNKGLLLSFAGQEYLGQDSPLIQTVSLREVQIYDIANHKWFSQQTSGDLNARNTSVSGADTDGFPIGRLQPCSVAVKGPNSSSYHIFMFGGNRDGNPDAAISGDPAEVWVLVIPAFRWILVDTNNSGLWDARCHLVGRSQIMLIGGQSESTDSCADTVFRIFDINTLSWTNAYDPNNPQYQIPIALTDASAQSEPEQGFTDSTLEEFFAAQSSSNSTVRSATLATDTEEPTALPGDSQINLINSLSRASSAPTTTHTTDPNPTNTFVTAKKSALSRRFTKRIPIRQSSNPRPWIQSIIIMSSDDIDPASLFYNTSFNLHKVTALNLNGPLTSPANLKACSTRLTNLLRGDVLRGVRVAAPTQADAASRTGNLNRVEFSAIQIPGSDDELNAVAVVFRFEKITYPALLVRRSSQDEAVQLGASSSRRASLRSAATQPEQTNYYPLLLTRLPAWLQSRFTNYLAENFDCHVSNLRLPSDFIMNAIEQHLSRYIPSNDVPDYSHPSKSLQLWLEPQVIVKDGEDVQKPVKLQTLKAISMTFARDDLPGMMYKGQELKIKEEEGGRQEKRGPFELALSLYAYQHMGMLVEKLKLQRAACGEFITGVTADGSGKCKFFPPEASAGGEESNTLDRTKHWDGMLRSLALLPARTTPSSLNSLPEPEEVAIHIPNTQAVEIVDETNLAANQPIDNGLQPAIENALLLDNDQAMWNSFHGQQLGLGTLDLEPDDTWEISQFQTTWPQHPAWQAALAQLTGLEGLSPANLGLAQSIGMVGNNNPPAVSQVVNGEVYDPVEMSYETLQMGLGNEEQLADEGTEAYQPNLSAAQFKRRLVKRDTGSTNIVKRSLVKRAEKVVPLVLWTNWYDVLEETFRFLYKSINILYNDGRTLIRDSLGSQVLTASVTGQSTTTNMETVPEPDPNAFLEEALEPIYDALISFGGLNVEDMAGQLFNYMEVGNGMVRINDDFISTFVDFYGEAALAFSLSAQNISPAPGQSKILTTSDAAAFERWAKQPSPLGINRKQLTIDLAVAIDQILVAFGKLSQEFRWMDKSFDDLTFDDIESNGAPNFSNDLVIESGPEWQPTVIQQPAVNAGPIKQTTLQVIDVDGDGSSEQVNQMTTIQDTFVLEEGDGFGLDPEDLLDDAVLRAWLQDEGV